VARFGLIQRARSFSDYEDLEANYERRPSAWLQPREAWGNGHVHLIEIPSEEEIHDNIVAFWQPLQPYRKSETYTFGYRLSWPDDLPVPSDRAIVRRTFSGMSNGAERKRRRQTLRRGFQRANPCQLAGNTNCRPQRQRRQCQ
jgi:periplasmic glucans biosynthesis protein